MAMKGYCIAAVGICMASSYGSYGNSSSILWITKHCRAAHGKPHVVGQHTLHAFTVSLKSLSIWRAGFPRNHSSFYMGELKKHQHQWKWLDICNWWVVTTWTRAGRTLFINGSSSLMSGGSQNGWWFLCYWLCSLNAFDCIPNAPNQCMQYWSTLGLRSLGEPVDHIQRDMWHVKIHVLYGAFGYI